MARRPTPRTRAGFARRTAARKRQGVSPLKETGAKRATKATRDRSLTKKRRATTVARRNRGMK